jgi:hypothetical protein
MTTGKVVLGEGVTGTNLIRRFKGTVELPPVASTIPGEAFHTTVRRSVAEAEAAGYSQVLIAGTVYEVVPPRRINKAS